MTVGTQLPFPRLIDAMDELAPQLGEKVIAQCGPEGNGWQNIEVHDNNTPEEFRAYMREARVVVAHAGIGTILTAKQLGIPLIIVPRRIAFDEHRNDHQLATARYAEKLPGIHVAWTVDDLGPLLRQPNLEPAQDTPGPSHPALVSRLRRFVDED
ncbi:glycosyltransferase [Actibacterium lipolyticum]|uniref:glycosyltransferase n=1 Tax=Actibacterium lipolyticum TaxID=1524263 RepID=UPI001F406E23|nr:glycosyltransferase [Actibacterium lipolyticum]